MSIIHLIVTWEDYENGSTISVSSWSYTLANLSDVNWANGMKGKDSYIKNSQNNDILRVNGGGAGCDQSVHFTIRGGGDNVAIQDQIRNGGSGAGGGRWFQEGTGITGQGNNGGAGDGNASPYHGGGGGGAGGVGGHSTAGGGSGLTSSITGTSITYAQGGCGDIGDVIALGGGSTDENGLNGTGGGGGGRQGGKGGSGVVILRILI